ncbi:unnamed protein product [Gongylonema pulchrum]|uniref:BTB_2 domain-containing protein n=1 Tax=Gongylonema pulchrum TaxID=637853 RepID=A0A183DKL4_9BILA|nr:unnamed protein product [Gongylonema pulchrum]
MADEQLDVIAGRRSQYIKLNVGGALYQTTVSTLTKHDSMLRAMFSGRMEVRLCVCVCFCSFLF